jgi:hypothetical protein
MMWMRNSYKIFNRKTLKRRDHLQHLIIWEYNIKMDIKIRRVEVVYRIHLAQDMVHILGIL